MRGSHEIRGFESNVPSIVADVQGFYTDIVHQDPLYGRYNGCRCVIPVVILRQHPKFHADTLNTTNHKMLWVHFSPCTSVHVKAVLAVKPTFHQQIYDVTHRSTLHRGPQREAVLAVAVAAKTTFATPDSQQHMWWREDSGGSDHWRN